MRGVRSEQLFAGHLGRGVGCHEIQISLLKQVIVDRIQACRTFRMSYTHFVLEKRRVGDVSGEGH